MTNIETSVEPPETDLVDAGGGDECLQVSVSMTEDDGTFRAANTHLHGEDDDKIADALVSCLRGLAAMRGPGLQVALASRLKGGLYG